MPGAQEFRAKDSDKVLVRRFVRQNDGESFSILMDRYADMVYTTCRRILHDETLAADAVQETFFQLAKNAEKITGSLGSWLHKVATHRSVDLIRQNVSRRNRERNYVLDSDYQNNSWSEVEPVVDEALEKLPDNLKEVLLLHFMQGLSTIQIAAAHGVSQPTISRRLAQGLDLLRQNLRERGIIAGMAPVQAVLLHSNHIAPEAVRASLGKIALAKAAGVASAKLALAAVTTALAIAVLLFNLPEKNKAKVVAAPQLRPATKPAERQRINAERDSALIQTPVVAEIVQAPSPIPEPPPTPTRAAPPQPAQTIASSPPAKITPRTNPSPSRVFPPPTVASSMPTMNDSPRRGWPSVRIAQPTVPTFVNPQINRQAYDPEFDWIPSLYKPRPEDFVNVLNTTNKNKDSKATLSSPVILPSARHGAFSPATTPGAQRSR